MHRSRLKAFMARFLDEVSALRVGDPLDPGTDMGSLVSSAPRESVTAAIERAKC